VGLELWNLSIPFGGNTLVVVDELFKRFFLRTVQNYFCAILRKFLLALSGPAHNIRCVKDSVKDNIGDKWG